MTPPMTLSQRQGLRFESGETRVLLATTCVCTSTAEPLSEKVPVPPCSWQKYPSKSMALKSAEHEWLFQSSSVSRREENEHCIRRLIKDSHQRQSFADVTAYFVLRTSLLHPRRVTKPVNAAGSSTRGGYSPLLWLPPGCRPMQRSPALKNSSVACGLLLSALTPALLPRQIALAF